MVLIEIKKEIKFDGWTLKFTILLESLKSTVIQLIAEKLPARFMV